MDNGDTYIVKPFREFREKIACEIVKRATHNAHTFYIKGMKYHLPKVDLQPMIEPSDLLKNLL